LGKSNNLKFLLWSTAAPSLLRFVLFASYARLVTPANVTKDLLLRGPPIGLVALVARPLKGQNDGLCGRWCVFRRGHDKEEVVAGHVVHALRLPGCTVPWRFANLNAKLRTKRLENATYELLVRVLRHARQMEEQRSSGHSRRASRILRACKRYLLALFKHSRPHVAE
jgi:hypothetical protein